MGRKKPQKKGDASQEGQKSQQSQPQQPQAQQPQSQPGPSGATGGPSQPTSGKNVKGKKQQAQQQQQQSLAERSPAQQQSQRDVPKEPSTSRPEKGGKGRGQPTEQAVQTQHKQKGPPEEGRGSQQQQQRIQKPAELPVQGAWQRGGPQQQKGVESHQSTPSPQLQQQRGPPQGRGQGRGQQVQPDQGARQRTPPTQPGTPHSPSPQPGQTTWGQPRLQSPRRQPPHQGYSQPQQMPPGYQQQQQPEFQQQYQQPPPGFMQQPGVQPQQLQQLQTQFQQFQISPGAPQSPIRQPPPGFTVQQQQQFQQQQQQSPPPQQQRQQQPPQQQQYQQQQQPQQQQQRQQQQMQQQKQQPHGSTQQRPQQVRGQQTRQEQPAGQSQGAWQKGHQKQAPQQQQQPQQPVSSPGQVASQQAPGGTPQPKGKTPPKGQSPQKSTPPAQGAPKSEDSKKDPSIPDLPIPRRQKLNCAGTLGTKITIETNHLALTLRKLDSAIHYDVVIEPDTPKKMLRAALEEFRLQNYPDRYPAFDGSRNLYSATHLPFGNYIDGEVSVMLDDRPKTFKITIRFASRVDLSDLSRYFEANLQAASAGRNTHISTPQDAIQCLDIVLRSAPALHCTPVGRSFFTKPQGRIINLGEGMEMYYGFFQSAILGWKPFLNVDVAHKAFPKCLKIIELILELCPRANLNEKLGNYDYDVVDKFLRTLKIQYEIPTLPTSRRVMRINQLDKPAIEARFKNENNEEMTVADYFLRVKGYRLKYPNMPCVWVGSRNRESKILFPVEFCTIMEGQVTNRAMTANQTSAMIKEAATSTTVRKQKIIASIEAAKFNQDPSAREFGISVSENFSKVSARILDAPTLKYNNQTVKPGRGQWRASRFLTGKSLEKWVIICLDDRTRPPALQEFAEMMIQQSKQLGMTIFRPASVTPLRLPYRQEKQELERHFLKLKDMQLILVVINENKDLYNFVKQAAELTAGTLTQCVKGKNVFRPKPATVSNILLKINAKLNGVNHVLEIKPQCLKRPCMIMGADVTHPSPESKGTVPSVAAVTASHDPSAFQYNICWRLQPPSQEIITDLANIVKQHLLFFYKKNNNIKPESIIFFRDGVSEGQFQAVLNAEINTIRQACTMLQRDGSYKPKITFLVVQKRHHTRFFPINKNDSDDAHKNFNVPAGTVVDTEITHPTALDFYLVSHASIQGVARPTKYRMLWDDNNMNEDELEQLTYHLCHMFTRCTRSVSYPAPTYYAHLAAARAKVYCERRHLNMNDLEREQQLLVIKDEVVRDLPMFFV